MTQDNSKKRIALRGTPTPPALDKPGRTRDQPKKKLDLVEAYTLRVVNRLSFTQIAKALRVPKSTVHAALSRLNKLVPDPEVVKAYEEVEASILTSAKERLLATMMDEDKLAKASLNNVAFAFSQVANHERLVKGRSTSNINALAAVVIRAHELAFPKQRSQPDKARRGLPPAQQDGHHEPSVAPPDEPHRS